MADNTQRLNNIYRKHLGRNMGKEGRDYWGQQVDKIGWDGVSKSIANSSEAERFGETGTPDTVPEDQRITGLSGSGSGSQNRGRAIGNMYQDLLGRAPDAGGLEYWNQQVGEQGLGGVRDNIANSAEAARYEATGRPRGMTGRDFDSGNFIDSVDPRATVEGRMAGLLDQDNRLMKMAETEGLQTANSRGLLNSSMAVGAAQDAMARQALPIARQDAGFFQEAVGRNQAHQQDMNRLHASSMANAWGVMANNTTDIVAQGMEGIANIQANPDIKPEDKTKMIEQITAMRDTDISFQRDLYDSLPNFLSDTNLFPNL